MLYIIKKNHPEYSAVCIKGRQMEEITMIAARTNRTKDDVVERMIDFALSNITVIEEVPEE